MQHAQDYQNDINIFISPQLNNQSQVYIKHHKQIVNIILSCDIKQRPGLYALLNSILIHLKSNSTIYIHLLVETTIDSFIIEQEFNLLFDKEIAKSMVKFEIKAFDKYTKFYKSLKEYIRAPDKDHAQHCYSIMTYARIYLSEIFINVQKALFLDTDIIVQNDITKIFEYDTTEIIFWCARHSHGGNTLQYSVNNNTNALKYTNSLNEYNQNMVTFNAGLYLYNLTYWRQHNMTERCENIFRYNKKLNLNWINQGDQSVLLLLFLQMGIYYDRIGHLNAKWNTGGFGWSKVGDFYFKDETAPVLSNYSVINDSYILHWNGKHKPWLKNAAYNSRLWLKYLPKGFNKETIYNFNSNWLSYDDTPQYNGYDWYIIQNKTLLHSMRTNQKVLEYIQSYGNNLDVSDIVSWKPISTSGKNTNCVCTNHFSSLQIENIELNIELKSISIYIINVNGTNNQRWLQLFGSSQYVFCAFSDGTSIISHSISLYDWNNNTNNLAVVKCKIPSDLIHYVSLTTEYSKILLSIISPSYIESFETIQATAIQAIPVCSKYINATMNNGTLIHNYKQSSKYINMYKIDDIHIFLTCDDHERIALYTLINSIITHYNNSTNRRLYFHILVETNSKLFTKEINMLFDISKFKYELKEFQSHHSYEFLTKYFNSVQDVGINGNHSYLFKHMNFARFYFTDIFDLDLNIITKSLYLDVDMIFQKDIQLLYDYNVNYTVPIMVPDVSAGNRSLDRFDFFTENIRINKTHQKILNISNKMIKNSKGFYAGIYLYDLRYWVNNKLTSKYEYYLNLNYKHNGKLWNIGTQPLINLLYMHGTVGKTLNTKWHLMGLGWLAHINESLLDSSYVLHWNGPDKPWTKDGKYKSKWLKYLPKGMRNWNFASNGWDVNVYDDLISNEMKVFEIGVAKTGTASLGIALEILGYKTADWNESLALEYQKTRNTSNIVLASKYFDAFQDGPWHTIDFRIWYYKYPNAKFILLERDDESWLKSYELWFSPKYNINNVSFKLDHLWITNRTKKRNKLLKYKHSKYKDAIQFFTNNNENDKLLIMNISEGLSWKPLCKFLNKSIPNIAYPTSHNSSQLMHQNMIKVTPISDRNHGNKLYRFQEFEWLNITNQTVNIE